MDKAGEEDRQPGLVKERWRRKKTRGDEILFLAPVSTLPSAQPLFHVIFLLSVLPLYAAPPTAAVVSFFNVSNKMGLNQWLMDLPGCTYSQFGAVELLRKERKRKTVGYISLSASLKLR